MISTTDKVEISSAFKNQNKTLTQSWTDLQADSDGLSIDNYHFEGVSRSMQQQFY